MLFTISIHLYLFSRLLEELWKKEGFSPILPSNNLGLMGNTKGGIYGILIFIDTTYRRPLMSTIRPGIMDQCYIPIIYWVQSSMEFTYKVSAASSGNKLLLSTLPLLYGQKILSQSKTGKDSWRGGVILPSPSFQAKQKVDWLRAGLLGSQMVASLRKQGPLGRRGKWEGRLTKRASLEWHKPRQTSSFPSPEHWPNQLSSKSVRLRLLSPSKGALRLLLFQVLARECQTPGQQGFLGGVDPALMVSFPGTDQRAPQLGIVQEDHRTCGGATQGNQDWLRHRVSSLCSSPGRVEEEELFQKRGGWLNDQEIATDLHWVELQHALAQGKSCLREKRCKIKPPGRDDT